MNLHVYHERENNKRHITAHYRNGHKVLEVEAAKVLHHGRKWLDLSFHDKRKFENGLFLENMHQQRIPLKFLYV